MELYYYTTTQTMQFILQNGDIFATNLRYMNDSEEYINGLDEIYRLLYDEQIIQEWNDRKRYFKIDDSLIKEIFNETNLQQNKMDLDYYSISFCEKNDLLSQWAIYAKESGVSIKMNFDKLQYNFTDCKIEEQKCEANKYVDNGSDNAQYLWELAPKKVMYFTRNAMMKERDLYKETAFEILDNLFAKDDMGINYEDKKARWKYVSTFVKRYDFYQEAEHRLTFSIKDLYRVPYIHFRNDKNVLKPYIDVFCKDGWPIWEIMVGPGFNQEVVFNSIKTFLNYADVKNQILNLSDYVIRVDEYLKKCGHIEDDNYQILKNIISDVQNKKDRDYEDTKIALFDTIEKMRNNISSIKEEQNVQNYEYFLSHYFTRSGVVLTKSKIPYIF